jgi:uncharacterized membrane protein
MNSALQWLVLIALVATTAWKREPWDAIAVACAAVLGLQLGAAAQRWIYRGDQ